jgi:hypothetical protein
MYLKTHIKAIYKSCHGVRLRKTGTMRKVFLDVYVKFVMDLWDSNCRNCCYMFGETWVAFNYKFGDNLKSHSQSGRFLDINSSSSNQPRTAASWAHIWNRKLYIYLQGNTMATQTRTRDRCYENEKNRHRDRCAHVRCQFDALLLTNPKVTLQIVICKIVKLQRQERWLSLPQNPR